MSKWPYVLWGLLSSSLLFRDAFGICVGSQGRCDKHDMFGESGTL